MHAPRSFHVTIVLAMSSWFAVPGHTTAPECGQSVQAVRDVKACSAEALTLDRKVEAAYARLRFKFRDDNVVLNSLGASQVAWRAYLNAQCVAENELPLSELKLRIDSPSKARRSGIDCVKHLLSARLKELEAL